MEESADNRYEGLKYYSPAEERLNVWSHALGLLASIAGLFFLLRHAFQDGGTEHIVSFAIYGLSMIVLYAASTFYHAARAPRLRYRLKIFDHASIYVLIAGTYTPFTLVTLGGTTVGWIVFGAAWGMALVGIVLKLFFTGRFKLLSTIMYVAMGWIIVLAINPLIRNLPGEGLEWLVAGGIAYTVGAVLYSISRLPFNHAIFHIFVLIGSFCHFWTVYFFVLA